MALLSEAPWLHQEVGRRLADKLAPIKLQPQAWIDWSAFLGASADHVRAAYPQAQRWVVEPTPELRQRSQRELALAATRSWKTLWRKDVPQAWSVDDLVGAPWLPDGVQMLWANMCLHAHPDLASMMRQWHRQLAVGGFLMCSGLGPDTARELRAVYRTMGWDLPTIDFIDMHDLGDELVKAGFADPVMDMERLTLTWETPQAMLKELRTWGGNVASGRHAGLKTPRWQAGLQDLLIQRLTRSDGRLGLTIEVVYGHAIKPEPRIKLEPETRVSLDDMRRMVRKQG
ncbi:biotin synthase [Aquabacterium sp.]|uniref:biotin synthase n=1 Tax=Aquabacterium sp. TaxID=1872578 RepID=UPI0025C44B51|nr:biotin synthase [Aquabacterium sp.]